MFTKPVIALTFDYEMFSRTPGSVEKNILIPTEKLLDVFDQYNIKSTFFVETVFILKLRELSKKYNSLKNDFSRICDQLQKMVLRGHRIELHLHPYWLEGTYDGSSWTIQSYRYNRLQSMPEQKAIDLFTSGVQFLEEIARQVEPNYKVTAFRAGGLCLEPFDIIKTCFDKTGITVDSSVAPGMKKSSELYIFDFTSMPKLPRGLIEIPITTIKRTILNKIKNRLQSMGALPPYTHTKSKDAYTKMGDGREMPAHNRSFFKKVYNFLFDKQPIALTLEGNNAKEIIIDEINTIAKHKKIITLISHPKSLTPNSFEIIKELGRTNRYEFKTLTELTC